MLKMSNEELLTLIRKGKYKDLLDMRMFDNKRWISRRGFQDFLNLHDQYKIRQAKNESGSGISKFLSQKQYISKEEAARIAGVSKSTVAKWALKGTFHAGRQDMLCGLREYLFSNGWMKIERWCDLWAFIRERDGKFSVVYKVKDDKGKVHQKSETFRKKKDAEKRKHEIEYQMDTGTFKLKNVPRSRNCWRSM